jgi:hypothetical protein
MKIIVGLFLLMTALTPAFCQHKQIIIPQYFPFPSQDQSALDTASAKWYSYALHLMQEKPIFNDKSKNETYRFLWLRTFHHPVAIRITKSFSNYTIYWKLLNGLGGYGLGKLSIQKEKKITRQNWDGFMLKLKQLNFWELKKGANDVMGNDGSNWVLEGKTPQKYHVIGAWTPKGSFYACGDYLIKLTNMNIKKEQEY